MKIVSELKWILPFACLGAIAMTLIRPEPQAQAPSGERVVVDARGKQVHIALPFHGTVLTRGTQIPPYLEATLQPDTILAATAFDMGNRVRNHIIGKIFPQVADNPRIWSTKGISDTNGPKVEIERMLLFNPGVYMGWYTLAEPVERVGLPFLAFNEAERTEEDLEQPTHLYADAVGDPERGNRVVAKNRTLFDELDKEFRPKDVTQRPSYLYLITHRDGVIREIGQANAYTRFFQPHTGTVDASTCQTGFTVVEAEHVIAEDPDFIVLGPQPLVDKPNQFSKDPRWRALKAVVNHRVYRAPPGIDYFIDDAFYTRWQAELAHPERLQPKSRELYRDYIDWLLNYRLSDEELDTAFAVKDNRGMVNANRFEAAPTAQNGNTR